MEHKRHLSRRDFLKAAALAGAGLILAGVRPGSRQGKSTGIPKYVTRLRIPPAMPRASQLEGGIDYYEIAVRQFAQQVLPPGYPPTTVWGYGAPAVPGSFSYPAWTIEAQWNRPLRVQWINGLIDDRGRYLPHLLPVDQTLHWANPPGPADKRGADPTPYRGPVPLVTHVHGAHTGQESDGYPEAWYLPDAADIPAGYARTGTRYAALQALFEETWGQAWPAGAAVFQYPNDQPATTMWYHDHTLGMTRLNIYAGPAGFYLLRGGPGDEVGGVLPGPAPTAGDPPETRYYEIPIVIQDRSFNADGSLFYPDHRAFFEGLAPGQLQIPFIPAENPANGLPSDVSPIWNPAFFGDTMVVNGSTWPELEVEPRRYRLRLLNGCNSRFLILRIGTSPEARLEAAALPFWQIGAEGGFLPAPVELDQLLLAPAERADAIVDFSGLTPGSEFYLLNVGPDGLFRGGTPGVDFEPASPDTTGQVLRFKVVPLDGVDLSTPPDRLTLPAPSLPGAANMVRQVSLTEEPSSSVFVADGPGGDVVAAEKGRPLRPVVALLGTVEGETARELMWHDPVSETPALGSTEIWEIHNWTMDAHPIHLHLVQFEVLERRSAKDKARPPEAWERGLKDTVIAYPGQVTRIKAHFDLPGLYVWHCHMVEHEDNEMMRPFLVEKTTHSVAEQTPS